MAEHRHEFHRALEGVEAHVIELFAMIAEDLPTATQALLTGNNDAFALLTERDQVIDGLYAEIEELVNREILLQAPVASDLRFQLRATGAGDGRRSAPCPTHQVPRRQRADRRTMGRRGRVPLAAAELIEAGDPVQRTLARRYPGSADSDRYTPTTPDPSRRIKASGCARPLA